MGSNGIKFLIFQDTTFECIIGSFDKKLSKFLFLSTGPLKETIYFDILFFNSITIVQ